MLQPESRFNLPWPATVGAVLACVTAALLASGAIPSPLAFHAILLGAIAWVYVGFSLQDGRGSAIGLEGAVAFVFLAVALFGLASMPYLIAAGFAAHALWDLLHHGGQSHIGTSLPPWYPRFCAVYDIVHAVLFVALGTITAG